MYTLETPPALDCLHDEARRFLEMGLSIIPVGPNKKPKIDEVMPYRERHPTEAKLDEWFRPASTATGIAVVTGRLSGVVVLDIEKKNGKEGLKSLWDAGVEELPVGPVVETPTGGQHRWCGYAPGVGCELDLLHGVDVKGEGGYVLVPPSWYGEAQRRYRWLEGPGNELPELPREIVDLLRNAGKRAGKRGRPLGEVAFGADVGERNVTLASYVGHLIARGMSRCDVRELAHEWNRGFCREPLPDREVDTTVESVCKTAERRGHSEQGTTEPHIRLTHAFMGSRPYRDLPPSGREVLRVLLRHADRDGLAWPSILRIASEAGVCRRTVQLAVSALEENGIVTVNRPENRRDGNRYLVNLSMVTGCGESAEAPKAEQKVISATIALEQIPPLGRGVPPLEKEVPDWMEDRGSVEVEEVERGKSPEPRELVFSSSQRRRFEDLDFERRRCFDDLHERGVLAGVALGLVLKFEPWRIRTAVLIFEDYRRRGKPCSPGLLVAAVRERWEVSRGAEAKRLQAAG